LEVTIAAAVLLTFAVEIRAFVRQHKHPSAEHTHPAVGWFDLAAGALLIFEAFHGAHHKLGYMRPQFMAGVVTLVLGLFHGRLAHFTSRRSYLRIDDAGVYCRSSLFRRFSFAWTDLASVAITKDRADFELTDGRRHTISLRSLFNAERVRAAIESHERIAGLLQA
jgi:hypothetical protein